MELFKIWLLKENFVILIPKYQYPKGDNSLMFEGERSKESVLGNDVE